MLSSFKTTFVTVNLLISIKNYFSFTYSKTTFVTVNIIRQHWNSSNSNSKTTFVTVNLKKASRYIEMIENSKTTFVTVNLSNVVMNCVKFIIQKQLLLLLINNRPDNPHCGTSIQKQLLLLLMGNYTKDKVL